MKRWLLGGLALLFFISSVGATVGAATAPPFPFRTYADATLTSAMIPVCENGGQMAQIGSEWRVISWPERDLFIHLDGTGTPDWAYLTVGRAGGAITVKRVIPVEEAKRLYPTGCEYGDEKDA